MRRSELLLLALIPLASIAVLAAGAARVHPVSVSAVPEALAPPVAPPTADPPTAMTPTVVKAAQAVIGIPAPAPTAALAPASHGMVLVADPETGAPGLPRTEGQGPLTVSELQSLARAEAAGLVTVQNPDGSEMLVHAGRFASHSIVRVGPDGKPVYGCVEGEGARDHALHQAPPAAPAAEDR